MVNFHENIAVRAAAAANTSCPPHALTLAADARFEPVRSAAASNPNTPVETLAAQANTRSYAVAASLAANPSCPAELLKKVVSNFKEQRGVIVAMASNPNCPPEEINRLSFGRDPVVRLAAIGNPSCCAETLAMMHGIAQRSTSDTRTRIVIANH